MNYIHPEFYFCISILICIISWLGWADIVLSLADLAIFIQSRKKDWVILKNLFLARPVFYLLIVSSVLSKAYVDFILKKFRSVIWINIILPSTDLFLSSNARSLKKCGMRKVESRFFPKLGLFGNSLLDTLKSSA